MKKHWILSILGIYFLQTFVGGMPAYSDQLEKAYKKERAAAKNAREIVRERAKAEAALVEGDRSDARKHARHAAEEEREYIRHTNESIDAHMRY